MTQLDPDLVRQAARAPRKDGLTEGECIAMNLLRRNDVRASILARVFQKAKNTVYYNSLTGEAASYPSHRAVEINRIVDRILSQVGMEAALAKYVPSDVNEAVNAANREVAAINEARAAARRLRRRPAGFDGEGFKAARKPKLDRGVG